MKFGIYPGGRAGTVCSHPPDPAAIRDLIDGLAGGRPFVVREYVHFFGAATPPEAVASLGADHELAHLTMPDEWYVEKGRELDLVVSYIPRVGDIPGWLAFLDTRHRQLRPPDAIPTGDTRAQLPQSRSSMEAPPACSKP